MWGILNQVTIAGNELWRVIAFTAVLLISLILGRLARMFFERSSARIPDDKNAWWRVLLKALAKPAVLVGFAVGLAAGIQILLLPEGVDTVFAKISQVLNAIAIGYAAYSLVDFADYYLLRFARGTESRVDDILAPMVGKSIRVTVAVLVLLNVLQSIMEEDVMTILAGLGVGGLAIALAGQDTIKNFFGAFVILGDKPFEIGDRIVVDGYDGPVEEVGFRSTKIRTLDGHVVTVPNSEMVNKTVQNIGRRPHIKRVMKIGITYDTPPEKVQKAVDIIKVLLDDHEGMDPEFPPRVFFSEFGDFALTITVMFWYNPPEYWDFMAFSECTNMEILRIFNAEGIEFAFPTQTIFLQNADSAAEGNV
jgi:MscS family membrane protein